MRLCDSPKEPFYPGFFDKTSNNTDTSGVFVVTKAGLSPSQKTKYSELRCDANQTGPVSFHQWDSETLKCSCGSLDEPNIYTGDHFVTPDMVTASIPLIEALPYGFILYIETKTEEDEETLIRMPYHARTFQEIFRYLIEWDWAYTELGSTEEIAYVANGILFSLNFPNDFKQWVIDEVPFEKLGRFLSGNQDANARTLEDIPPLPDAFSEWLYEKIESCRQYGEYDA